MKASHRILFINQQMAPYTPGETPLQVMNRALVEYCQTHGFETRTFLPKLGEINERRNQLHEMIRLSGMNVIINDSDHPLLLKVANMLPARVQVYFIDNDDYFHDRVSYKDENGVEYEDNDERCIFFSRGVVETATQLRWSPDIIQCSGWMGALIPLYLKTAYKGTPFFSNAKIVLSLDNEHYDKAFGTAFADKLMIEGVPSIALRGIKGFPVGYEELMRLAIDHADAIVMASGEVNQRLINYAEQSGKPILAHSEEMKQENYVAFYNQLLEQ